jgi:hypothetical protein
MTYLANHKLRRSYGVCPLGAALAKVCNAVAGLKRGPRLGIQDTGCSTHCPLYSFIFTNLVNTQEWFSGTQRVFCLNLYCTKLRPIPASCTVECVRDETWFRVWSISCTFSSAAKGAWEMTNNGTEWHDPRCALQVSMGSPATGKHVPENSKLPTPCTRKELQGRRLARTQSPPFKSSIGRKLKKMGNLFRGMTWTTEMERKLCQVWTWPPLSDGKGPVSTRIATVYLML